MRADVESVGQSRASKEANTMLNHSASGIAFLSPPDKRGIGSEAGQGQVVTAVGTKP